MVKLDGLSLEVLFCHIEPLALLKYLSEKIYYSIVFLIALKEVWAVIFGFRKPMPSSGTLHWSYAKVL